MSARGSKAVSAVAVRDRKGMARREKVAARRRDSTQPGQSTAMRDVEAAADRIVAVAARDTARAASIAPVMNAVAMAAESEAGLHSLVATLEQPEFLLHLLQDDPLARARLRGLRAKQRLLHAEGGVLSGQGFADLVGVSRQAIDKRRRNGTLIGLSLGKKGYHYPVWQVDVEGLKPVLAELRAFGPWTQASFMLTGNSWFGGETPLAALRHGQTAAVVEAASMYGEQAASSLAAAPEHTSSRRERR